MVISNSAGSNRLVGLSYNPMARALPSQEAIWDLFVKTIVVLLRRERGSDDVCVKEIVSHR